MSEYVYLVSCGSRCYPTPFKAYAKKRDALAVVNYLRNNRYKLPTIFKYPDTETAGFREVQIESSAESTIATLDAKIELYGWGEEEEE